MMKLIITLIITYITLIHCSCTKVLFDSPMPIESELAYDFPSAFLGNYLYLEFTPHSISSTFLKTSKEANKSYFIESQEALRVDSLSWANQGLGPIQDIVVKTQHLEIITDNSTHKWLFKDALITGPPKKEKEIDLQNGLIHSLFGDDREQYGEYGDEFELRKSGEKYYLNSPSRIDKWHVIRISQSQDGLNFDSSSLRTEDEEKLKDKKAKHDLTKIKYDPRVRKWGSDYSAKSDDLELEELLDDPFFESVTLYKIDRSRNSNIYAISIAILLISLAFAIRQMKH